jgi:hypothetical protein
MTANRSVKHALFYLCVAILLEGCFVRNFLDRAKQLRTYANMQAIVGRIEEARATGGEISDKQIAEILRSKANGRDEWGRLLIYGSRRGSDGFSYIVASLGRDGRLDVPKLENYYTSTLEYIDGKPDRDIVFVNGSPLKNAGK